MRPRQRKAGISNGPGIEAPALPIQLLFYRPSVNLRASAQDSDQALTKSFSGTNWLPSLVIARWVGGTAAPTCKGSIYTSTSKGGTAIIDDGAGDPTLCDFSSITGADVITVSGITAANSVVALSSALTASTVYMNLSTTTSGSGSMEIFVYGFVLG